MSRTVIITGNRGIGKSTVCRRVAEIARMRGYSCAGIISHALFNERGEKVGFTAEDISTGKRWVLGHTARNLRGPRYGLYRFSRSGFRKAHRWSSTALKKGCDLFILDEIGPLEMEMGGGFRSVLFTLSKSTVPRILLVVRPALLGVVKNFFSSIQTSVVSVDLENRDRLPELIFMF